MPSDEIYLLRDLTRHRHKLTEQRSAEASRALALLESAGIPQPALEAKSTDAVPCRAVPAPAALPRQQQCGQEEDCIRRRRLAAVHVVSIIRDNIDYHDLGADYFTSRCDPDTEAARQPGGWSSAYPARSPCPVTMPG